MVVSVGGRKFLTLSTEGIDEVWNKIFFGGAGFENFFFVFYDNFVVGNFDDFFARDEQLGIHEAFHNGALDDDLLD